MYERGIGLDDRESPKRLTTELAELVLYRYHLGHNEGNFVRVVNFNEIQNFWNTIFCEKDVSKLDSITFTETDNNWIAKVEVYDGQFKTTRTFISSGENQVLALGLVCGALLPKNSLILLDEGDLHLSVSAGKLLYEELYNQAIDNDLQIIMVSHLSYLFPNNLHDDVFSDAEKDSEKALADFIEICESRKADGNDENKFVTSIFVKKDFDDVTVNDKKIQVLHPRFYYQGNAAEQAAKLQMADMEAVLAASRSDRPSFWITLKAWYLETNKWLKSGEFLHEFRREFNRLFVK
jgi:hypothetical protein